MQGAGAGDQAATGLLPHTPETQKILEFALSAENTGHPHRVGTEHILLGLVGADEAALVDFGVAADRAHEALRRAIEPPG